MAFRDSRGMVRTATHWRASFPHRPDEFTNTSGIVHDPVANYCRDKNFEHFKIFAATWHAVTTGSRTLHATSGTLHALTRLESCQCVSQNRRSVSLALDIALEIGLRLNSNPLTKNELKNGKDMTAPIVKLFQKFS